MICKGDHSELPEPQPIEDSIVQSHIQTDSQVKQQPKEENPEELHGPNAVKAKNRGKRVKFDPNLEIKEKGKQIKKDKKSKKLKKHKKQHKKNKKKQRNK